MLKLLSTTLCASAILLSPAYATQPIPKWAQEQMQSTKVENRNTNTNTNFNANKQGQKQGQAQGQAQGQQQGQSQNAFGGRGGKGGAGGAGGEALSIAEGGKGGNSRSRASSNNRSSVSNNVKVEGDDYEAAASSAFGQAGGTTSPCTKGFGFGVQTVGVGTSVSYSSGDQWCRATYECDAIEEAYGPQAVAICYSHFSRNVNLTLTKLGYIN